VAWAAESKSSGTKPSAAAGEVGALLGGGGGGTFGCADDAGGLVIPRVPLCARGNGGWGVGAGGGLGGVAGAGFAAPRGAFPATFSVVLTTGLGPLTSVP